MSTYDVNDKLVVNKSGFARIVKSYDKSGKEIKIASYGTDGRLRVLKHGYARMTKEYDGHGNMTEEAYFGADDEPILINGCARLIYKYDSSDNKVGSCCYNVRNDRVWCE